MFVVLITLNFELSVIKEFAKLFFKIEIKSKKLILDYLENVTKFEKMVILCAVWSALSAA